MDIEKIPVKVARRRVTGRDGTAIPDWVNVDVGMQLDARSVRFLHKVSQRVPERIRRLAQAATADALGPRLQAGRIVGVGSTTDLEEDGIEAGESGIVDDFVDFGWGWQAGRSSSNQTG